MKTTTKPKQPFSMMITLTASVVVLLLFVLLSPVLTVMAQPPASTLNLTVVNENCDLDKYYASLLANKPDVSEWTWQDLQSVIGHTIKIPSVGQKDQLNILDALVDLDYDMSASNEFTTQVKLYMRDIPFNSAQVNRPEGWRRGDIWPQSRGATLASKAGTDIHAKRPTDWEVDEELKNLFWGTCGKVQDGSAEYCKTPAISDPNAQTADSTATDGKIKTPPDSYKGIVARSLFYTAVRYSSSSSGSGTDEQEQLDLQLTDCPPFSTNEYGYKSELLTWHSTYNVTDDEIIRNNRICQYWQGNRNPFIDYPILVEKLFGPPDKIKEGTFTYESCTEPTMSPTATPNECSSLQAGDLMTIIFNSEPGDEIVFFPVSDIPEAVESLYITDRAWNGTHFVTDEGTIEYNIPEGGIKAGQVFGYGVQFPKDKGTFEDSTGIFDLTTTAPDNLLIYCMNADGQPHFLSALTTNGQFSDEGLDSYTNGETALPSRLSSAGVGYVALPFHPHYLYEGIQEGSQPELVAAFSDPQNYRGSNTPYDIITSSATVFGGSRSVVLTMTAAVGLVIGVVANIGL